MKSIQPKNSRKTSRTPAKWMSVPLAVSLLAGGGFALFPSSATTAQAASAAYVGESDYMAATLIPQTLKMKVNGQLLSVPGAVSKNGDTTYVALRFLSDKLGLATYWNPKNLTATVSGRRTTIVMKATDPRPYEINMQKMYGTPPVIQKGTTYIPLRFYLETFGYHVDYNKDKQITVTPLPINALTIAAKTINETNSKQEFLIQYPDIEGFANEEVQASINSFLQSEVKRLADAARKELKESEPGISGAKNSYTMNYFIKYNMNGKLSLYLESYLYTGGAHGMPARNAYTFNLSTGKRLTLQEVVGGNPDYKAIINKVVKKQFAERDYMLTPFESISDNQPFYLQYNAVVVYFEPYEYTPYAAGFPEFTLPLTLFKQ